MSRGTPRTQCVRAYVLCPHPLVTKLLCAFADTFGMDGRDIEPRLLMWALAEISWEDGSGAPCRAPATLEDRSQSGACLRVKRPLAVGCVVMIKWHREQFSAIARNCRQEGRDFLVGVKRDPSARLPALSASTGGAGSPDTSSNTAQPPGKQTANDHPLLRALEAERARRACQRTSARNAARGATQEDNDRSTSDDGVVTDGPNSAHNSGAFPRRERKDMESKALLPKFWRRAKQQEPPEPAKPKEVAMNKPSAPTADPSSIQPAEMLSYEDIYHAAGIMSPRSGYGIQKVVEMLNSERIRDLSQEIKRASVLMALDAAGTSIDDVLKDATRRQEALNSYEGGKKKQVEDFDEAKSRENGHIEQEMERLRAHYAERIQRNCDLVSQEKEGLRNWQMAMQHEVQRIAEVIEVCSQPAPAATNGSSKSSSEITGGPVRAAASSHSG